MTSLSLWRSLWENTSSTLEYFKVMHCTFLKSAGLFIHVAHFTHPTTPQPPPPPPQWRREWDCRKRFYNSECWYCGAGLWGSEHRWPSGLGCVRSSQWGKSTGRAQVCHQKGNADQAGPGLLTTHHCAIPRRGRLSFGLTPSLLGSLCCLLWRILVSEDDIQMGRCHCADEQGYKAWDG